MKAKRASGKQIVNEFMNEHIHLPGCPQVIVTRAWAHSWLVETGYDGGWQSMDRMCFGAKETSEPLSDLDACAPFLRAVEASIRSYQVQA